jgi:hypothetical protein
LKGLHVILRKINVPNPESAKLEIDLKSESFLSGSSILAGLLLPVRDFPLESLIQTYFKFESRLNHPIIARLDIHLTRQNVDPFSAPIAAVVQQGSHLPGIIYPPGLPSPRMPIQGYPP